MEKYDIKKLNNYEYELSNEDRKGVVEMQFYDMISEIKDGDKIYLNKGAFNEIEDNFVAYGNLDSPYGRKIESHDDKDVACIEKEDGTVIVKRLFG